MDDQLVALDHADRGRVGLEQSGRLLHDFVEDCGRIELGCEQRAHARELLGEGPRRAFALVELASLERAACGPGKPPRELQVVVDELARRSEEDDHQAAVLPARRVDGDRKQRAEARLDRQAPPRLAEAIVVRDVRRSEHAALGSAGLEHRCGIGEPVSQELGERFGQLHRRGQRQAPRLRHQHCCCGAAERLGRSLSDRVQSRRLRERLGERRGDAEEAALDPRLADALFEARGVPHGQRREPRECLEQLGVGVVEVAFRVPRAHAEDATRIARPGHRCCDRAGEARVRLVRHGLLPVVVVVGEHGAALPEGFTGEPATRRELELQQRRVEPVDRGAAQNLALLVQQVTVGRVGVEQLRHLDDEPLQHGLQPQLAGDDLGRLQQGLLLFEPLRVLLQQARRVHGEPDLAGDCLRQSDLGVGPGRGLRAVEPEDPDHAIEHADRRGENRCGAEVGQGLPLAERWVVECRIGSDVPARDRAPFASREVGDGKPPGRGSDRNEAVGIPLRADRERVLGADEPDEAPRDPGSLARLLDGDPEDGLEVVLRAHLPADRSHEPLSLERVLECGRRARPLQGEGRLGGQSLEEGRRGDREDARLAGGGRDEDRGDTLVGDERDEDGALGPDLLGQPPVDHGGAGDVVDGDRSSFEGGARDRRGLGVEIDRDVPPPDRLLTVLQRIEAVGATVVLLDDRNRRELDVEQVCYVLQKSPGDSCGIASARQRDRERSDRLEVAVTAWIRVPRIGVRRSGRLVLIAASEQGFPGIHWALGMIGRGNAERQSRKGNTACKDGPRGLFTNRAEGVSFTPLGDAIRGLVRTWPQMTAEST